jgi:predicted GH43/DUF377 family glycosyl hydrolase
MIDADSMQRVFEAARTPHKYGIVLRPPTGTMYDCPSVFRHRGRWYMLFVSITDKVGYETHLAGSDDLLHWEPLGKVLPFRDEGWDRWQADGGIALQDTTWGGSAELQTHDGKYWLSYLGGALQGYETDPLAIGLAWTDDPSRPTPWTRLAENPVLQPSDPDARPFERKTLYKSNIIRDPSRSLGAEFVIYYNGKQEGKVGTERIGMAVSDDMLRWRRLGDGPVIDNGERGISGDPQVVRMGDLWVMFYFGHVWKPKAFDTFACSRDLVDWTKWDGPHLVEPTEPWDATFAHKPWVIKWDGVVYHFYCAVGNEGRAVALATSEDLR